MRRTIIPYNPMLKEYARKLRNNSTLAEILLWSQLKRKNILGYDFHRQKPLDNYIVDFFCNELNLAIEIDGITHDFKMESDKIRQTKLESYGIKFLRFTENEVRKNLQGVVLYIKEWIKNNEVKLENKELHTP
jgi:very-short-patch-repair endonuclease